MKFVVMPDSTRIVGDKIATYCLIERDVYPKESGPVLEICTETHSASCELRGLTEDEAIKCLDCLDKFLFCEGTGDRLLITDLPKLVGINKKIEF